MNLTIKTNFGEFNFDMDEQSAQEIVNQAFQKAAGCKSAKGVPGANEVQKVPENGRIPTEEIPKKIVEAVNRAAGKSRVESLFGNRADWNTPAAPKKTAPQRPVHQGAPAVDGYKGFMFIKCEKCGEVKGFCAKHPMKFFVCGACGHKFDLRDLRVAHVKCNCCGSHFDYKTNYDTERFEIPCLRCDAPVDMELNNKGTAYVVISREI